MSPPQFSDSLHDQPGSLSVHIGCMFSGKTSALLNDFTRLNIAGVPGVIVKYAADVRFSSTEVVSHCGTRHRAHLFSTLKDAEPLVRKYRVIAVDEAQFFEDVERLIDWAAEGHIVLVAALDATFEKQPFGNILCLIPHAEFVQKHQAVCMECGNQLAAFSKKITDEMPGDRSILIGGADKFVSACRKCFETKHAGTVPQPVKDATLLTDAEIVAQKHTCLIWDDHPEGLQSLGYWCHHNPCRYTYLNINSKHTATSVSPFTARKNEVSEWAILM